MVQSIKLGKQTTHLVCARPEGLKYEKALEWGVQVVKPSWLYTMAQSGRMCVENAHRHDEGNAAEVEEVIVAAPAAEVRVDGAELRVNAQEVVSKDETQVKVEPGECTCTSLPHDAMAE